MTTLVQDQLFDRSQTTQLVRDAQSGDRSAFGQLFERCERAVYVKVLRRVGNHSEAQELCQEVFIKALEKLHQLRAAEAFVGWLLSIADRMAINRVVRRKPVTAAEPQVIESACVETRTPLGAVLTRERQQQVRDGLDRLGTMDRDTLVAFYVRGRTLIEMSDEFASPVGTIKRRLHVARKRLKKELGQLAAV